MPLLRRSGFTLVEVLITLSIVGVLSSIAIGNYSRYVQESRRADGRLALVDASQSMERCVAVNLSYRNCALEEIYETSPEKNYSISLVAAGSTYTVTATGLGQQSHDEDCNIMSLNNEGVREPESANCW